MFYLQDDAFMRFGCEGALQEEDDFKISKDDEVVRELETRGKRGRLMWRAKIVRDIPGNFRARKNLWILLNFEIYFDTYIKYLAKF